MAATRLFDIHNLIIGSTQLQGAESLDVTYGFREQTANTDGGSGVAARDRTAYTQSARLNCEDPAMLPAILALYENSNASAGLTVKADGRIANSANAGHIEVSHTKLLSARLSFQQGSYASLAIDLRCSIAAASEAPSDELTYTAPGSLSVTHSSSLRGYRLKAASFVGTSTIAPLGLESLNIDIRGQEDSVYGDAEFGEVCEISGYDITGNITFRDVTLGTGATVSQRLLSLASGYLNLTWAQQNSAVAKVLRINNLIWLSDDLGLNSRRYHSNSLSFGCFTMSGSTHYLLGTAPNAIFAVDPA